MPAMYNLLWVPPKSNATICPARDMFNTFNLGKKRAVILYPSLLTPAVVSGLKECLEVLLLSDVPLTPADVNTHLKICKQSGGLDAEKAYHEEPLFDSLTEDPEQMCEDRPDGQDMSTIKIGLFEPTPSSGEPLDIGRFAGVLHDHDKKFKQLKDKGFKHIYIAVIRNDGLKNRSLNMKLNGKSEGKVLPKDVEDREIVDVVLKELNGEELREHAEGGKYCFEVTSDGVDITECDLGNPIQSYHPVFHYPPEKECLNIGHLGDVHVTSRHQVLGYSKARVIEYADPNGAEQDLEVSPPIGTMMNSCCRNLKAILDRMGRSGDTDVVLISGDIIDYVKGFYSKDISDKMKAKEIWDKVSPTGDNLDKSYQEYTDYILFYSLIINFYNYEKPVFLISGNHDCYSGPYGISPKVFKIKKANEGIPADHNLTFAEAYLLFGPDRHALPDTSMFEEERIRWFYTILTPFSDYAFTFKNQIFVGLGWGEDEDVIDVLECGHGLGHLPRAQESVSDAQLKLLELKVRGGSGKTILFSHFTFASFAESIPLEGHKPQIVYTGFLTDVYSKADMGTFEKKRLELYKSYLLDKTNVQCILTGHSHRRGLYVLEREGVNARARMFDFDAVKKREPAIRGKPFVIVSDSAGPIPRHNKKGEFSGWGSDLPSGTSITFAKDGAIGEIKTVPPGEGGKAPYRPRFAVVVDYLAWQEDLQILKKNCVRGAALPDDEEFLLMFHLHGAVARYVDLEQATFYFYNADKKLWSRIPLAQRGTENTQKGYETFRFGTEVSKINAFEIPRSARSLSSAGAWNCGFLSMKFDPKAGSRSLLAQYDFTSHWNCPVSVIKVLRKTSYVKRDAPKRIVFTLSLISPDHGTWGSVFSPFIWRPKWFKAKYGD